MVKIVQQGTIDQLLDDASKSPRKRSHYNLHDHLDSPVQRLLIGLKQGTYVTPHCHQEVNKWELMVVLKGTVGLLLFEPDGSVHARYELSNTGDTTAIEIPPGIWHTVFPVSEIAVIMEVKEGPYLPNSPASFAPWAPAEGVPETKLWLNWASTARVGDHYAAEGMHG